MSHLGDRVAALVDGELDHESRDRALAHIATCDTCRAEVEAERRLKARIRAMSEPELTADLRLRLLSLAVSPGAFGDEVRASRRRSLRLLHRSSSPPREPANHSPGPSSSTRAPARPGRQDIVLRRHRTRLVAAGAFSMIAFTLITAFAVGGSASPGGAPVRPAVDQYAVEHAVVIGELPLADPYAGSAIVSSVYPALASATAPETMQLLPLDASPAVLGVQPVSAAEPAATASPSTGTPAGSANSAP